MRPTTCALLVALAVLGCPGAPVRGADHAEGSDPGIDEDTYALDGISRYTEPRGKVRCPDLDMVRYRGDVIRYHKPVLVAEAFRERLRRFEEVVKETAIEVYGRAPVRIRHLGTYNCRRIRSYPTYISEHGLGNAIDVEGFDFAPARGALRRETPRPFRGGFQVRLDRHWGKDRGAAATHARFLRLLAERLVEREDIFRVLLGPSYPGHKNHFHFDVSPWRIVEI